MSYTASAAIVKLSIAVFLLRIAVENVHRRIIYFIMVLSTTGSAYFFFVCLFQCKPMSLFWDQDQPGHCVPPIFIEISLYTYSGLSSISDFTLGTLPIFIVWNLNMNTRTKISVALILSLGALYILTLPSMPSVANSRSGSVATIVRIPYIYQLALTDDFLYANTDVAIWSTVEPGLGITAGAMACLRPLFQKFLSGSRFFASSRARTPGAWRYASQAGYFRSRDNGGVEELALHRDPCKRTHVETVIEDCADGQDSDLEAQTKPRLQGSGSKTPLKEETGSSMSNSMFTDNSSEYIVSNTALK